MLALARKGHRRRDLNAGDLVQTLRFPGFRRLARAHARTGAGELWRDVFKRAFVADMQRYLPEIQSRDVSFGPSGIRAQVLASDGRLVNDFLFVESEHALHVVNAPSPGATSCLAIGRLIAKRWIDRFDPVHS